MKFLAYCTIGQSRCEISDDVIVVLILNFLQDMSGHERYENFDGNAINKCFLFSKSRLNLICLIHELGARKVVTRITLFKCNADHGYF